MIDLAPRLLHDKLRSMSIPESTRGWRRKAVQAYHLLVPTKLRPRSIAMRRIEKMSDGGHILGGVFQGMRYFPNETGEAWYARILGLYEMEIAEPLRRLLKKVRFTRVVNVGCAEGYCTVGLAIGCPEASVIAFDLRTEKLPLVHQLAEMNSVGQRVTTHGLCDAHSLDEAMGNDPSRCLIFIDVEGAELDLLDPVQIPKLRQAYILLETHEALRPGSTAAIRERFRETHNIEVLPQRPRSAKDLPLPGGWLTRWYLEIGGEDRNIVQEWWIIQPKAAAQDQS